MTQHQSASVPAISINYTPMSIPVVNDPRNNGSQISSLDVPTIDSEVRVELRKLGEPITLFGEGPPERRRRLQQLLEERPHTNFEFAEVEHSDSSMDEDDEEEFYTPGTEELEEVRKSILRSSVNLAIARVNRQKEEAKSYDSFKTLKHRRHINKSLGEYELNGTNVIKGNTRAISSVRVNKANTVVACGSWDGNVYFFKKDDELILRQAGKLGHGYHSEKVGAMDWHPTDTSLIATGGQEGSINIWRYSDDENLKPQTRFREASEGRIPKVAFHPSGVYLANTSFDQTWKFWDINKEKEVLEQEGHSKEVFGCAMHPDGSLFATGDLDGVGRIWDLRSGRSIATLEGHIQGIYSMDWSPNGHHLASASGDCSTKIWDLRKLSNANDRIELFLIPAHTKLVSEVRFFSGQDSPLVTQVTDENEEHPSKLSPSGTFLATSSYDGTVKLWSADNWINVRTLKGHNDKVMSCDIGKDGLYIVSCGWDRTVKTWSKI